MGNFAKYTNAQLENLINQVYSGSVNARNLPVDLYETIVDRLSDAVFRGFGIADWDDDDLVDGSADKLLSQYYRHNIAIFSGAKTFQQVKDMSNLVFTSDGFKRDFSEFKRLIKGDGITKGLFNQYNDAWLRTEYDTAFRTAQMGRQWNEYVEDSDVFPFLKYVTVHDERVRHDHAQFDGITLPIGHKFWNTHTPPNGFNCRCRLVQISDLDEPTITPDEVVKSVPDPDSELFEFNPAKHGYIFDESKHPYLRVSERYKVAKETNFGFPTPPKPSDPLPKPKLSKKAKPTQSFKRDVFEPQKTIKDVEQYAKNVLEIDHVNFSGFDLNVANAMLKGIFETKQQFPKMTIGATGSGQKIFSKAKKEMTEQMKSSGILDRMTEHWSRYYDEDKAIKVANDQMKSKVNKYFKKVKSGALAFRWGFFKTQYSYFDIDVHFDTTKFQGVFLNDKWKKSFTELNEVVKLNQSSGWFANGVDDISYIVTHELGHQIDDLIGVRNDPRFRKIYDREHAKGIDHVSKRLSRYGATAGDLPEHKPHEMIAEAWAEYKTAKNPRPLATEIGQLIESLYKEKFR